MTSPANAQLFDQLYVTQTFPSFFRSIERTLDGGYVIVGGEGGPLWLLKVDHQGDTIWSHQYDVTGGENSELHITSDGGLLIGGTYADLDLGVQMSLLRMDENGQVLWHKSYGTADHEFLFDLTPTADGGALLVGGSGYGSGIVRVNDQGDTLWTRVIGGGNQMITEDACIVPGSTDLMLTGEHVSLLEQSVFTIRMTDAGQVTMAQLFDLGPLSEVDAGHILATDGGFVIGGFINESIGLIATDTSGYPQWVLEIMDSTSSSALGHLSRLSNGDLLLSAYYYGMPTWMRISPTGTVIWSDWIPMETVALSGDACEDNDSLVMICTQWKNAILYPRLRRTGPDGGGSCSVEPLPLTSIFHGIYDPTPIGPVIIPTQWYVQALPLPSFQGKPVQPIGCMYAGIEEPFAKPLIEVHPVPADHNVQLEYGSGNRPDHVAVFSSSGQRIEVPMITSTTTTTIDTRALSNGAYVIRATIDQQALSARFVVMH